MAETKGSNILAAYQLLSERIGDARTATIIKTLPQELREPLATQSLARLRWYPVALQAGFLAEAERNCAEIPALMRDLGREAVRRDMQGIYRILVKAISPRMLISWGPRTFAQYYRGDTLTVKVDEDGIAEAEYLGWTSFNSALWQTVAGGVESALAACGGGAPQATFVSGGTSGDARLRVTWETL